MSEQRSPDEKLYPPSYFANLGSPSCSRWGKSEIEWIALAYVQALANDGDTWKKLSRKRAYELLSDKQQNRTHGLLTSDFDVHKRWFEMVSAKIIDSDGAFGVGGYWRRRDRNE